MFTGYLVNRDVIGSTVIEAADGDLLLMYSASDGKHFLKSSDHFRTVRTEWVTANESLTANANLIRLRDGRLMTILRRVSADPVIADIKGASYYTAFSDDDGHSFHPGERINRSDACYYLMNDRILRTQTGRILLPVCYVPPESANRECFEKSGWSGCFYSDDEGSTWQEGAWLQAEGIDQLAEPMVMQGTDSALHMYMRTGYGYLYRSVSHDGGVSWARAAASVLRSPCAPFCVKCNPWNGLYYAVWDNSFPGKHLNTPRSPICLAESDDGVSWRFLCELDHDPMRSYGYPMLHFTPEETLITYYESPERVFRPAEQRLKLQLLGQDELDALHARARALG